MVHWILHPLFYFNAISCDNMLRGGEYRNFFDSMTNQNRFYFSVFFLFVDTILHMYVRCTRVSNSVSQYPHDLETKFNVVKYCIHDIMVYTRSSLWVKVYI